MECPSDSHVSGLRVASVGLGSCGPVVVGGRGRWREGELRAQTLPGVAGRCSECPAGEQPVLFLWEGGGLVPALGRSPVTLISRVTG